MALGDADNCLSTAFALQEKRQQGLDGGEFANEVNLHRLLDLFYADTFDLVESRLVRANNASVVDKQIQTAVCGLNCIRDELCRRWVPNVGREDGHLDIRN